MENRAAAAGSPDGLLVKLIAACIIGGQPPRTGGGGLVRSLGGWSQVVSIRRHGDRELSEERILGDGDFVQRILEEAEEKQKQHFSFIDRQREMHELDRQDL